MTRDKVVVQAVGGSSKDLDTTPPFISHFHGHLEGEQPQLGHLLTMVVNNPLFLADSGFGEAEVPYIPMNRNVSVKQNKLLGMQHEP